MGQATIIGAYLPIGGGTITGNLTVNGTTTHNGLVNCFNKVNGSYALNSTSGLNFYFTFSGSAVPVGANSVRACALVGSQTYNGAADNSSQMVGVLGQSIIGSTGNVNQTIGINGIAQLNMNGGAYTGSMYGGLFQAQLNGTSSFDHIVGVKLNGPILNGAANYACGLYVQDMTAAIGTGSATVSVAIEIEGSGIANSIAWGNGGSVINASIYSPSANALIIGATGGLTITGPVTIPGGTLLATSTALANNAAASLGTLTNAPAAGNPTKWIPVNDNGTVRNIPAW